MTKRVPRLLLAVCLFLSALHIGLHEVLDHQALEAFWECQEAGRNALASWQPGS